MISTDYYREDPRFETGYVVRFGERQYLRTNPVDGEAWALDGC